MNAVASTTPPWNPPEGLVWACEARYHPITRVGPTRIRETIRMASLVGATFRSIDSSRAGRCRSPRRWRSTMLTPTAAAKRMNSSPRVSKARYAKLTADTTPVAFVWATAMRLMMSPYGPG